MQTPFYDPASVAGKAPPVDESTDLLIVGAGPAGIAAALEAAGRGIGVTLVDENPVPLETMGEDVPLHDVLLRGRCDDGPILPPDRVTYLGRIVP